MSPSHKDVLQWIASNGYPFELTVARLASEVGWNVSHGDTFEDVATGKLRQGDLTIWALRPTDDRSAYARLELSVECKRPAAAPWVAFRSRLKATREMLPTLCGRGILAVYALSEIVQRVDEFPILLLGPDPLIAHTVVQTMGKKDDPEMNPAYSAIRSATSAALASARLLDNSYLSGGRPFFLQLTLPVVAVDAELFEYSIASDGEPQLRSLPWCATTCPDPTRGASPAIAYVAPAKSLSQFLTELRKEAVRFFDAMVPRLPDMAQLILPDVMKVYGEVTRKAKPPA